MGAKYVKNILTWLSKIKIIIIFVVSSAEIKIVVFVPIFLY